MSISRFLRTYSLTLLCPFIVYASTPNEQSSVSVPSYTQHHSAFIKEINKTPEGPGKFDKFISKHAEAIEPDHEDEIDVKPSDKPEAARPLEIDMKPAVVNLSVPSQPLFNSGSKRLSLIDKTYLDVFSILQENNSCSKFFGGPRIATDLLNSLHPRLDTALGENHVGISMVGPVTFVTDAQTGARYRLFKKALVNLTGPFYRSVNESSRMFFHQIGRYPANTREARATMLLHEMGHLLHGSDGRWLLENDWNDRLQIADNTEKIMDNCGEQIKALAKKSEAK